MKSSKNSKTARVFLAVLHFNNYFFNLKTKANPSPKGNGFVFTLIGDPYGFLPLVKGKANVGLRGVCCPTLFERNHLGSAIPWIAKRKHTPLSVLLFFGEAFEVKDELSISSKVTVFDLFL